MKSKLVIISLTLFFFNSAHAICIPRNRSTPSPFPDTPPNLKPVSSPSSSSPKASTPAPKSSSSPKAPSSPSPKSSSSSSSSSPKAPTPLSSPKAPTSSSPATKSFSPKAPTPSPSSPKASTPSTPQKSPSNPAASTDSSPNKDTNPITPDHSLLKIPTINDIKSAIPKLGRGNPAIKKICDSTDYPDVCLTTLGPLSGPADDVSSVLSFAIKAGSDFAKTALGTAEKLAGAPGTPPDLASSIKDCKDNYDDVSYNFEKAANALPKKDIGTLNTMLSAALTDVGDCQDAFEGQDSPLTTISDQLRKMASNCLATVDLMNK